MELDSRHCLWLHRCHFSRVVWCRNSSSPIARMSPSCVSVGIFCADWHSLSGTAQPERTILPIQEVFTVRGDAVGRAPLGAPVPASSNLKRPNGEVGSACVLVRRAFASLGPCQPFV